MNNKISPIRFTQYQTKEKKRQVFPLDTISKGVAGAAAGSFLGMANILMNDKKEYNLKNPTKIVGRNILLGAGLFVFFDYLYNNLLSLSQKEDDTIRN